jgi:FK506-binding protein 1
MGVIKHTLKAGNGTDIPQKGDDVVIEYTGCLYDESAPDHKGKQ